MNILRKSWKWAKKKGWRFWARFSIKLAATAIFVTIAAGIVYVYWAVYYQDFPKPDMRRFTEFSPPTTGSMYDGRGERIMTFAREYRYPTRYQDISNADSASLFEKALIATEDQRFWRHSGVDWMGVGRAVLKNSIASLDAMIDCQCFDVRWVQGASTIDMQMVRLLFLPPGAVNEKSASRKLREAQIAIWINKELRGQYFNSPECKVLVYNTPRSVCAERKTKEEIMARYVNLIYLSHGHRGKDQGRFGVKAGAEYWFGKDVKSLDVHEAALLAGIIKNPNKYAPTEDAYRNRAVVARRNEVIGRMEAEALIAPEQAAKARVQPLIVPPLVAYETVAPHAVSHARREMERLGFESDSLFYGAYDVHVTIDSRIQRIANEALDNGLDAYRARHPELADTIQGAVVVVRNSDGAVLAEVGGRFKYPDSTYARSTDFNRVIQAWRQPGSVFKPFVYVTALEAGWSLESIVNDQRYVCVRMGLFLPRKCINNYDNKFKGKIALRQCLAESRNACTMWLAEKLGIESIARTAWRAGVRDSAIERYPSSALGASVVNPYSLVSAYRTFATGYYLEPYIIKKIVRRNGSDAYTMSVRIGEQIFSDSLLPVIHEALRGTIRLPSGTGWSLDDRRGMLPVPIMGKTGTTDDFKDAWFVAATPGLGGITLLAVVFFDNAKSLGDKEAGARAAAPMVKEIITRLYNENIITEWPQFPEEIENNIDTYINMVIEKQRNHTP